MFLQRKCGNSEGLNRLIKLEYMIFIFTFWVFVSKMVYVENVDIRTPIQWSLRFCRFMYIIFKIYIIVCHLDVDE